MTDGFQDSHQTFLRKLRAALGPDGSRGLLRMTFLAAVAGVVEVLGMGAVMQFMVLVSTPDRLASKPYPEIGSLLGVSSQRH